MNPISPSKDEVTISAFLKFCTFDILFEEGGGGGEEEEEEEEEEERKDTRTYKSNRQKREKTFDFYRCCNHVIMNHGIDAVTRFLLFASCPPVQSSSALALPCLVSPRLASLASSSLAMLADDGGLHRIRVKVLASVLARRTSKDRKRIEILLASS